MDVFHTNCFALLANWLNSLVMNALCDVVLITLCFLTLGAQMICIPQPSEVDGPCIHSPALVLRFRCCMGKVKYGFMIFQEKKMFGVVSGQQSVARQRSHIWVVFGLFGNLKNCVDEALLDVFLSFVCLPFFFPSSSKQYDFSINIKLVNDVMLVFHYYYCYFFKFHQLLKFNLILLEIHKNTTHNGNFNNKLKNKQFIVFILFSVFHFYYNFFGGWGAFIVSMLLAVKSS